MNAIPNVNSVINQQEEEWSPSLDALVAAPDHHKLLLENERVRVLDTRIAPGERTPIHTHRWSAALYVLSRSNFVRYDDEGKVLVESCTIEAFRVPPVVLWSAPLPPHLLENVGETELHIISVELK